MNKMSIMEDSDKKKSELEPNLATNKIVCKNGKNLGSVLKTMEEDIYRLKEQIFKEPRDIDYCCIQSIGGSYTIRLHPRQMQKLDWGHHDELQLELVMDGNNILCLKVVKCDQ